MANISVKALVENSNLTRIPASYAFQDASTGDQAIPGSEDGGYDEEPIPVIDFSLLTSGNPEQRDKVVRDLGYACKEWGFFMVNNHGVDEDLMKRILDRCREFFDLTEEEKRIYQGKHVLDPIRCGTSFNSSVEETFFWRDYLKVLVHPEFHSPIKPVGFSKVLEEYTRAVREVVRGLLGGISESLGLESCHLNQAAGLKSSLEILSANLYPPCPQPELVMGLPPHSDHGLLTVLIQNGVGGLQIHHKGKWVNVNAATKGVFLVNSSDQMEILSNGKYKSVLHRAVVNNKSLRMSIVLSIGPSPDTFVSPIQEILDNESSPAAYIGMKYKDYVELQQSNKLYGKSCLDRVKIIT